MIVAVDTNSNAYDIETVSRILRGETAEFRKIVEKYQNAIYRLCLSYVSNHEEAEDAAQDIFLRAYKSLHRFNLEKRFYTWLYTIALNNLKTRYSRILRFKEKTDAKKREKQPDEQTPEEHVEKQETSEEIDQSVRTLPAPLKEVVLLYYFDEKSVAEITEILGLSSEAVKSRLHRARKKLREKLEKNATER
jgi:RNA polymerase sigma factor (sigma-70 family)